MFPDLDPYEVPLELIDELARRMHHEDGADLDHPDLPAGYTYFGQFLNHDLTFDPVSSLRLPNDPGQLEDFRTPRLDLDAVYGSGPGDMPYLYDQGAEPGGALLLIGDSRAEFGDSFAVEDLPRNMEGRALIGDPRNDENSIVSQLQGLFLRFHNRMVDDNPGLGFEALQQRVRFHYQYVVLNDFLPRIVSDPVLTQLKTGDHYDRSNIKFFHWKTWPFMPVEFSVACYRLGHSMIRPGYRLNDADDMLLSIFPDENFQNALTGFQTMAPGRAIDWGRFIDLDVRAYGTAGEDNTAANKRRLQFAYRIDPSLVNPLHALPPAIASDPPSLLLRNLERGWRLELPSGQAVAKAMHITPLDDSQILIGKAVDTPDTGEEPVAINTIANGVFAKNCPLWTYVLAEAANHKVAVTIPVTGAPGPVSTPQLGPVGGRIVAEVILGLIFGDNFSVLSLDPHWAPVTGPNFKLKDLVSYALGQGPPLH